MLVLAAACSGRGQIMAMTTMVMINRDLLVHTSVAMEIGEATCDIMPVWWYDLFWLPRVTVHADVIERVRTSQPVTDEGKMT